MQQVAAATTARSAAAPHVAYLEHNSPSVGDALSADTCRSASTGIDALGLFLSDGYHAQVDVPRVLAAESSGVSVTDHGTLGMGTWLLPALERNLAAADVDVTDPQTGLVLVAAGSSRPQAREQVVQLAGAWQRERGGPVRPAFASGPGPTVEEALDMLSDTGCRARAVALLLLAPGVLADRVIATSAPQGAPVARPIGAAPEVVDRIIALTSAA